MRFRVLGTGWRGILGILPQAAVTAGLVATFVQHNAAIAEEPARVTPASSASPALTAAETRLKADVSFLAADAREGRAPGTNGIEDAARYIAETFKQYGLKPAPGADGYFQRFHVTGIPRLGEPSELTIFRSDDRILKAELKTEFSPLAIGTSGSQEQIPIAFAGYGITAKDSALRLDYDDYAGVDVRGKAVLIIRREPQQDREDSPFAGTKTSDYATFRHKASNAFQHGAAMVLLVNDLAGLHGDEDRLLSLLLAGRSTLTKLPFAMLSRKFADKILAAAGEPDLAELEKQIDADLKPRSRVLRGVSLSAKVTINRPSVETENVVGVLEGVGPLAEETIIIGGHYDHLGRGGSDSGSLSSTSTDIHNGADDNASGTAMVLEMARRLGSRPDRLPRRVVFMAFSGEERGLLGSQYYADHPLYPLASTVMMVNFDMVGRLNGRSELTMIGTGTSPGIDALVDVLGKSAGLTIKKVSGMTDGFGGSDHQSFYGKNIPVLFAFTGMHPDYHRPSDDSDRINYTGMGRIADYVELIVLDLVRRPERPAFARLASPSRTTRQSASASAGMSVTMGVMPDYADEAKAGMKITGVRDGGPAAKAGLKGGDTIVRLGGKPISTIYDYMESLKRFKPGDKTDVVVVRDGTEIKIQVVLGGSAGPPRN